MVGHRPARQRPHADSPELSAPPLEATRPARAAPGVAPRPEPHRPSAEPAARQSEARAAQPPRTDSRLTALVVSIAALGALGLAWHLSAERHLTPKEGAGYWLGICGASLILAQLLYPMRKHMRWLRGLGSVAGWFRMHMLLGVIGPVLILFHSGFRLDSKNATVATLAMLTVVLSGIVGRFLYMRLHMGLQGRKVEATQLLDSAETLTAGLGAELGTSAEVLERLRHISESVLPETRSVAATLRYLTQGRRQRLALERQLLIDVQSIVSSRSLREAIDDPEYRRRLATAQQLVRDYFAAIEKVARLRLYERIFATWHLLHLPLFGLLIITAIMHIISVHLY